MVIVRNLKVCICVCLMTLTFMKQFIDGENHNTEYNSGVNPRPIASTPEGGIAADIAWEFENGLSGWAQATPGEMQAEVYVVNGVVRIVIEGEEPHLDSPKMSIPLGKRQTVAIRYRYVGYSKFGKIRLRGRTIPDLIDYGKAFWGDSQEVIKNDQFHDVYFPIVGDGKWRIAYAKINWDNDESDEFRKRFNNTLTQMRIWPAFHRKESIDSSEIYSPAPNHGNIFQIDWLRIVRGPLINRVTGCFGEIYSDTKTFAEPAYFVEPATKTINSMLQHHRTIWSRRQTDLEYGKTYNCVRGGNEIITLEGFNFGFGGIDSIGAPAHVYIDHRPCKFVQHDVRDPQRKLTCITPPASENSPGMHNTISYVKIQNGKLTGLEDAVGFLQYASSPPSPRNLSLSNFASRSVDISWSPGGSIWDHLTYTGFVIYCRKQSTPTWESSYVVGNITTTTIRQLAPNTSYFFAISGLNENQSDTSWWNDTMDLYGRREKLGNGLEGPIATISGNTLAHDVYFPFFDANSTQNHGPLDQRNSLGPTGMSSGEGHFGLILVGDANIENCNSSSYCCDEYDSEFDVCINQKSAFTCRVTPFRYEYEDIDNDVSSESPNRLPGSGKIVEKMEEDIVDTGFFSSMCGPSLRITGSYGNLRGAAWYPRQLEVGEGFDTQFTFRISNPSVKCSNMDGVFTRCRSRGGDGFAFVIQNEKYNAMGGIGHSLGYGGIQNSLAVEFDTYYNYEDIEPYENHISVQTRGWRHKNDSNQTFSLGYTNAIPDLTDGNIPIRIKYVPRFDPSEIGKPTFVASPYLMHFFTGETAEDYGDWGKGGLGLIYVYCENMLDPVLVVPLNLASTLDLNRGRAWVGFTAATGSSWQVHDILNWKFSSLRQDKE